MPSHIGLGHNPHCPSSMKAGPNLCHMLLFLRVALLRQTQDRPLCAHVPELEERVHNAAKPKPLVGQLN